MQIQFELELKMEILLQNQKSEIAVLTWMNNNIYIEKIVQIYNYNMRHFFGVLYCSGLKKLF